MNDHSTQDHETTDGRRAARPLRLAGALLIAGALVSGVFNALHPIPGDSPESTIQGILDAGIAFWKFDHLMMMLGVWLLTWGFVELRTAIIRAGPGAAAARLGVYGLLMTTGAWTLHAAIDGFARADVAATWAGATGAERETAFALVVLMQQITDATFPMVTIFHWGALATVGIGLVASARSPSWWGFALALPSAGLVVLGCVAIFAGFSPTWDILFATFSTLTTLWALVVGVLLVRRPAPDVARRAGVGAE